MREYAKVAPSFWTGSTGKKLRQAGADCQRVALYLLTCPSANMIGLYYLPLPTLIHEVGISKEGASKALRRVSEVGFAYWDDTSEHVFIPEMAAHQLGEPIKYNDNRVKSIIKEWQNMRKSPFYKEFWQRYKDSFHLPELSHFKAPSKPLQSPFEAPSKPGAGAGAGAGAGEALPNGSFDVSLSSQSVSPSEEEEPKSTDGSAERNGEKQKKKKKKVDTDLINAVVDYYLEYHPRARPGNKERALIATRLGEKYTVDDLCQAIDGCHKSPHHCGQNNSNTKYQSLELIVRDSKHVAQFIEIATGTGRAFSKNQHLLDEMMEYYADEDEDDGATAESGSGDSAG